MGHTTTMEPITTRAEPRTDSDLVTSALRFARRVHLGQHRKQTDQQFVEHPIAVARLLAEAGHDGPILAAAYLHDVVEKTPVELGEIDSRFGHEVAGIVDALTEDASVEGYGPRKRALRAQVLAADHSTILIYAADRVANLRDWVTVPAEGRDLVAERLGTNLPERLELWQEDLGELTAHDEDLRFLAEIEIELRALQSSTSA
jgi:(p)ppGpp synthase/HD superfamily hydrolase